MVGKENIPLKNVRSAYWISGIVALIIGLFLVLQTSLILFYIGFGGMLIGALYTMGPLPINSASFGEFFVGLSMGVGIFTSMVYINAFDIVASIPRLVGLSLLTFPYILKKYWYLHEKTRQKDNLYDDNHQLSCHSSADHHYISHRCLAGYLIILLAMFPGN